MATPRAGELELSRRKQLLFSVVLVGGFFLFLEVGSRLVHAAWTQSTYALVYGLPPSLNRYAKYYDGYFKYVPHKTLYQQDTDPPIAHTINSRGFRGPDFEVAKQPGVYRILTLGASSTYGYHSRDDYTYPAQLQRMLDERAPGRFEVLNLGLPMYTSSNILALLRGEGVDYGPDLVTLYAGYNDTFEMRKRRKEPAWIIWPKRLHRTSFFLHLAGAPIKDLYSRAMAAPLQEEVAKTFNVDAGKLAEIRDSVTASYLANVEEIIALAEERGFDLLFVRQPMTTRYFGQTRIAEPMAYPEEVAEIERLLAEEGAVWRDEASILIHAALMERLMTLAAERGICRVDGIAHVSEHPDHLVSWVHLSEEGNESLARAILESCLAPSVAARG